MQQINTSVRKPGTILVKSAGKSLYRGFSLVVRIALTARLPVSHDRSGNPNFAALNGPTKQNSVSRSRDKKMVPNPESKGGGAV